MATPNRAHFRRNFHRKSPSSASSASSASRSSSLLNPLVFLHEWWLIKAGSDLPGRRLGVGGQTFQEKQGVRNFLSAPVVKREDAVTFKTADGVTIIVNGLINKSRTIENGFPGKVCDRFVIGFPFDWEDFAGLSFDEHEDPALGDDASGTLRKIFDDILQQCHGEKNETFAKMKPMVSTPGETLEKRKKEKASNVDSVIRSGPLTRSRVRSLDK